MSMLTKEQESLRKNDNVQSVLFDKKYYRLNEVCIVVRLLGYNCFYIDETDNYFRVRQFNPGLHNRPRYYNNKSLEYPGVMFVIEVGH